MKQMLHSVLVALLIILLSSAGNAQITNPGFETWTNNQVQGWFTPGIILNDVSRSTVAHSGSSSLKASVVVFNNSTTGSLIQSGQAGQGFPVNQRYGAVSGYYQFTGVGGDQFTATAVMYSTPGVSTSVIGAGEFASADQTGSTWRKFTVPIDYIDGTSIPQNVVISIIVDGPPETGDQHQGSFYLVDDISLDAATDVKSAPSGLPASFELEQNFPNPFNPSTSIRYSVPKESYVRIAVYNVMGQEVSTIVDGVRPAGIHTAVWNGISNAGTTAGSGVYFCRMNAGAYTEMRRMMLLK